MFKNFALAILLIAATANIAEASKVSSNKKIITGWLENVYIPSIESRLRAKLDTGAKTSSIDAEIIDIRDGTNDDEKLGRIIFSIEDSEGQKKTLERKIMRWVKIKKKANVAGFVRRPVVIMEYCIAGKLIEDEVNLANRQHFNYPVLIGRNMLEQAGLVIDTSKVFTRKPNCQEKTETLPEDLDAPEAPVKKKPVVKIVETPKQVEERLENEMKTEQPNPEEVRKSGLKNLKQKDDELDEEDEDIEEVEEPEVKETQPSPFKKASPSDLKNIEQPAKE